MTDPLWSAYLSDHPEHADLPDAPVSGFGDSPALRDELLALVLSGTKRATASLLWQYEADGDPVPDLVITGW